MVSIIHNNRAIPIYFDLLNKKGSSNFQEQKEVLEPSLNLLKEYKNDRLKALIILITLAYSYSTFMGEKIKGKGISEYVVRPREKGRNHKRHSDFSIGLNALNFLDAIYLLQKQIQELMSQFPQKKSHYLRGLRAIAILFELWQKLTVKRQEAEGRRQMFQCLTLFLLSFNLLQPI